MRRTRVTVIILPAVVAALVNMALLAAVPLEDCCFAFSVVTGVRERRRA